MGRRLVRILREFLQLESGALTTASSREQIRLDLIEKGYLPDEVDRAIDWYTSLSRQEVDERLIPMVDAESSSAASPFELTVSDRAFRFLTILRELGIIDLTLEDEILNRLMMAQHGRIELEDVKRMAATVVFERQFDGTEEFTAVFDEEWRMLFN